ncbi:hypothetical protein [Kocuria kalidii]|uniref:hypothetical protein n=1 Tax=Kocuria kalidii TaxID=3376283 RepID=UPI0037979B43
MNPRGRGPSDEAGARAGIRSLAGPPAGPADLERLVERWNTRMRADEEVADRARELSGRRRRTPGPGGPSRHGPDGGGPGVLDATRNATVAVEAGRSDRSVVRGDRPSWNVRDGHTAETAALRPLHHERPPRGPVPDTGPPGC